KYGDFTAVQDISFEVRPGSTHALVGESGSGKTTTGRMISLFETPTAGSITVDGVDILAANAAERKELRSNIQLVYQNP
ncbi:ATP-binding cassette domain-containing protein, partial [Corynebacterium stationis]